MMSRQLSANFLEGKGRQAKITSPALVLLYSKVFMNGLITLNLSLIN
jgi:hypothetical protein